MTLKTGFVVQGHICIIKNHIITVPIMNKWMNEWMNELINDLL